MKKKPKSVGIAIEMPKRSSVGVEVEPIENGFLATHTRSGPDVPGGYETKKVYHRTHPAQTARPTGIFKDMKPAKVAKPKKPRKK